jgi:hypothetical protein
MGYSQGRAGPPELLHYRPWQGTFRRPGHSVWPIARIALWMMLRRRLFWALYGLGMMIFLLFFFGQYLLAWLETQVGETDVRAGLLGRLNIQDAIRVLRFQAKLNGTGETYRNFFWYQGYMIMVILALTGSILVGNDLRFGSLPYYLSKPLSRWHYLLGKGLAVAVFINLMTTLPALVLFAQFGLLDSWGYFEGRGTYVGVEPVVIRLPINHLIFGILGYGAVLTVCLTLILLATATWLRRTVPLIMTWTTLFTFCRFLSSALVDGLGADPRWRLIDLWNNTYLVGMSCLQLTIPPTHPSSVEAALVLGGVCLICLIYLILRIRAVEIVT